MAQAGALERCCLTCFELALGAMRRFVWAASVGPDPSPL